jgi:hypothetical protein
VAATADAPSPVRSGALTDRFVIGNGVLEVDSDDADLTEQLDAGWGDCRARDGELRRTSVRAVVRRVGRCHVRVRVDGDPTPDLAELAACLLRPDRRWHGFGLRPGPRGSSRLASVDDGRGAILVGHRDWVLIDLSHSPPGLTADLVIAAAQSAQRDVTFAHAGSLVIGGRGVLLVGASGAGKTTTTLELVARGHGFLGDDVAAIRVESAELLPCRRSARLRQPPRPGVLADALRGRRSSVEEAPDGRTCTLLPVTEALPRSRAGAAPLRHVFVLDGFASRPRLAPFTICDDEVHRLAVMAHEETVSASWGPSRGRQLMRFLGLMAVLARSPAHLLTLGTPSDTATLIEQSMEEQWD